MEHGCKYHHRNPIKFVQGMHPSRQCTSQKLTNKDVSRPFIKSLFLVVQIRYSYNNSVLQPLPNTVVPEIPGVGVPTEKRKSPIPNNTAAPAELKCVPRFTSSTETQL